ncbi:hypothetical protein EH240_03700 [Mesorhizobium tamadayense]|uniref:Uncharacterized protein n=1 Tax=Mesorhizobium tamadayense TaxID=425306 RepID=A0A3P3G6L8_9HYPH|nr:hypothetical protein [Mesorhizobium tamadayense]RRI06387.1 hypothetical protein EH240_03700 [Mesorhizobium tamadayense]
MAEDRKLLIIQGEREESGEEDQPALPSRHIPKPLGEKLGVVDRFKNIHNVGSANSKYNALSG